MIPSLHLGGSTQISLLFFMNVDNYTKESVPHYRPYNCFRSNTLPLAKNTQVWLQEDIERMSFLLS